MIHEDDAGTNCVMLMDYKMKFEPMYFWEKLTKLFGKKGLSWHGSVIFSCEVCDNENGMESNSWNDNALKSCWLII